MRTRAEDGYVIVYPDEDSQWTGADIIGELMAGSYAHGAWVKIHGVDMRLGGGSYSQNVWYIHPPGEPDPVEAINVQAFQTASALEEYLKNFDPTERTD